jgi:hypothetical protein
VDVSSLIESLRYNKASPAARFARAGIKS